MRVGSISSWKLTELLASLFFLDHINLFPVVASGHCAIIKNFIIIASTIASESLSAHGGLYVLFTLSFLFEELSVLSIMWYGVIR